MCLGTLPTLLDAVERRKNVYVLGRKMTAISSTLALMELIVIMVVTSLTAM